MGRSPAEGPGGETVVDSVGVGANVPPVGRPHFPQNDWVRSSTRVPHEGHGWMGTVGGGKRAPHR
jgi:hypothetical protein